MTLPIELDRAARVPIYQQVAGQIKQMISAGSLPAGARLPTIRRLAEQLGVTRLTVQTAYAELQSGGWIEATIGRGTFVSAQAQAAPSFAAGIEQRLAGLGDRRHFADRPWTHQAVAGKRFARPAALSGRRVLGLPGGFATAGRRDGGLWPGAG